jgi:hypothetical protein
MPFGSRRFFTGRTFNPEVTTITFNSPQGVGSSQPKFFTSASVSGDTAGNTVKGNGTYTALNGGTADLEGGMTGGANNAIVVPLTEGRSYTIRLRKTLLNTLSGGGHPSASYPFQVFAPKLSTTNADSDPVNVVSQTPFIQFRYDRVANSSGATAFQTNSQFFQLTNHDRSSDVMASNSAPFQHIFQFSTVDSGTGADKAMDNDTLTLSQNFVVASGDNDTAAGGTGFTAKGLVLSYEIDNSGSGHNGNVVIELFQS